MIVDAAVDRFERQAMRLRRQLATARQRGEAVPTEAQVDDFLSRRRAPLLARLSELLVQRQPRVELDQADAWTDKRRMEANLLAMDLLARKPPGSFTTDDRQVLARYSGWGGLSLDKAAAAFPPSLEVDSRALLHEYYTPSALVREIARVTQPLLVDLVGLDGIIRAIEPSAGIGRFILAFDALKETIRWTAVESSALASRLLAAVRPGLALYTGFFEQWVAENWASTVGTINLVVCNPPFGDRGQAAFNDKDKSYRETTAMAYFLRRGLDLLAPGGLGIYIVPMGLMSGPKRRKLRETLLLSNHLVTAYRLPSQIRLPDGRKRAHFPGAHNVTDLIFFRRRAGQLAQLDPADVPIAEGRYFELVPGHILGTVETSYREAVVGPPVILPTVIERPICADCRVRTATSSRAVAVLTEAVDARVAAARALVPRVDSYLAALGNAGAEDPTLLWAELHDALTSWTKRYGSPYLAANLQALASDKELARSFLRAFTSDGDLIPGLRARPPAREQVGPRGNDVLSLADHVYRQERGLSIPRLMQELAARGIEDSREEALQTVTRAGWCFDGPNLTMLLPPEDYLSGDLWARYDRALQYPDDSQAQEQARRLLAAIRPALYSDLGDYSVREGWVPLALIAGWLTDGVNYGYPELELYRDSGLVQVRGLEYNDLDASPRLAPLTINFIGWVNHDKKNFKPEKDKKKQQSLNERRDEAVSIWSSDFRKWVLADPERQRSLVDAYNRAARGFILPKYSDAPIAIARWTKDPNKQLKDYQREGVDRLRKNRGGALVYDVGVGKTFTAAAAIAVARQDGLARRPVVLVPKSLILQWRDELATVLPDYRVLLVGTNVGVAEVDGRMVETAETDTPGQRAQKWARFQTGEYDVALLTYSSMPRTRLNLKAATELVAETPALMRLLALTRRSIYEKDPKDRTERERAILEEGIPAWILERLELQSDWEFDGEVEWDDLGIDMLVIDEVHNFKNLFKPEPRERGVPAFMGSSGEGSARAWQLAFRAAAVRRTTGGAGVIGLSATPAKNGPIELFTLIFYINPRAWTDLQIYDAEQFVDRFCLIEVQPVVTVSMQLEERSAMVGFKNLRDLRSILTRLLEMRSANSMAALGRLKKPTATEELVRVDLDAYQKSKTAAHADAFTERMASGGGNMALGLIVRLGLVAVHAQLDEGYDWDNALGTDTMPAPASFRSPKFLAVAERIVASPGCGHIVFLEPLAAQIWLREVLVEFGIPRQKIALLNAQAAKTSADRARLAKDFNAGKYIVVISNSVGGEGANLQRRTCAVHNVDLPWDPMTRRQRNGRADRQGNELPTIVIYDYLARSSGDGPRFAKIQGKGTWIDQVMESDDDIATNPSAMVDVPLADLLADLTTDPERTKALLEQARREQEIAKRSKLLRQVGKHLRAANARFRAAEEATSALEAQRFREDGQEELEGLRKVDPSIWPYYDQARQVERLPALISTASAVPFFEGLQVWTESYGRMSYREFGRVDGTRIGMRLAGAGTWSTTNAPELDKLEVSPASFTGAWADDGPATIRALAEAINAMGRRGTWEDLGLMWASERWLGVFWAPIAETIRQQLASRTWSTREEFYPCIDPAGRLFLATTNSLAGMLLMSPGAAGFQEFENLAAASEYRQPELRAAAMLWWERPLPATLRARLSTGRIVDAKARVVDLSRSGPPAKASTTSSSTSSSTRSTSSSTRSTGTSPSTNATRALPESPDERAEEARMGDLLRAGRDDEEARWAAAVERGAAAERAGGLATEAARRAAIKNLAANIDHYNITYPEPGTPLEQQDPASLPVLARIVAALGARFDVQGVRAGQGYRVVELRSKNQNTVFAGLPLGTLLTSVSLYFGAAPAFLDGFSPLKAATRAAGRGADQMRAIRTLVEETVAEAYAATQGAAAPAAAATTPAEVDTKPLVVGDSVVSRDGSERGVVWMTDDRGEYGGLQIKLRGGKWTAASGFKKDGPSEPESVPRGHYYRVGDRWFGDTQLIPRASNHMGYGDFEGPVPGGGKMWFSVRQRELPGQVGRLHELSLKGGSLDLPTVLERLSELGDGQLGGTWDDWPQAPGPTTAPLAAVEPAAEADDEEDEEAEEAEAEVEVEVGRAEPVVASAGGLAFTIAAAELEGALNLIQRVAVAGDKKLSLVQIECKGTVFFRTGSEAQFLELRLLTPRCITAGDATVDVSQLASTTKGLTSGALQLEKTRGRDTLVVSAGKQRVTVATEDYVPLRLDADLTAGETIPFEVLLDLIERTVFAISKDSSRTSLHILGFRAREGRLTAQATNSHMLVLASADVPNSDVLDGQMISYSAVKRLLKLLLEYRKYATKGRKKAVVPPLLVQRGSERLALSTELFTFVAARPLSKLPNYDSVVPQVSDITTLVVAPVAVLTSTLKGMARQDEAVAIEIADGVLQLTSPTFSTTVSEAFIDGPDFKVSFKSQYLLDVLKDAVTATQVLLGFTKPAGAALVLSWLPSQDKTRRDARNAIANAIEGKDVTVIMPRR